MQLTAKGERKIISQYITIFQTILEFSVEKLGLEVIIKHNKSDADNLMDDINSRLIEVCDDYLKEHKMSIDKFQLATIVADLWSQTISSIDEPFRVTIKESRHLVQDYLEKNKSKREALERIKKENNSLDDEIAVQKRENSKKKAQISEVKISMKPEMPSEDFNAGGQGNQPPIQQQQKQRRRGTDALAISDFRLPI